VRTPSDYEEGEKKSQGTVFLRIKRYEINRWKRQDFKGTSREEEEEGREKKTPTSMDGGN